MVNRKQFKPKLESLVKLFESNENYYKSKDYKEDHLRQEFLNPFFKSLGWDMDNEQHFAPQYREVIHEDRIEIEGKPKAPDYSFRIGNERKFFVEAKAAFVNIEKEMAPSFQLRRYSWSGKLPVSILSDFEEFSIYDTTIEPKVSDNADIARIKYIQFQNYPDEIDYLWDTFSKEAVWSGSFDKFAKKERRGNDLVDKAFLKEIEQWRNLLAKDIAVNNPRIDIFQLNEAVQKIIDRIIFLRIAEDRGIEGYETLKEIIKYQNSYPYLVKLFYNAQEKYNSNLFDFNADIITPKLKISDRILDRIIGTLYFPKSPYEFSVIGVEILGSVYEQFLGKVIRLTKGHNAIIEEKPEVKKAGGVYYTPKYIVDYIVKNTVGELVKRKTPKEVSKLRIVDPACGSGSFLLGAYTFLLDWHLKYYTNNDPSKYVKSKALFKDNEGNYLLSTAEKKRILINNIYGVDIDAQAVEVSKLSLALKILENENSETINAQLRLFAERILPDLSTNIKCGNSLVGSDYYDGKDISTISDEEIRKINAFDWEKEFGEVFKQGGFDAVIGNPPWVSISGKFRNDIITKDELKYLINKYSGNTYMPNIYEYFISNGLAILKRNGGRFSFIVPDRFGYNSQFINLRKKVLDNFNLEEVIYKAPFPLITTDTLIFTISLPRKNNYSVRAGEFNKDIYKKDVKIYKNDKEYKFTCDNPKDYELYTKLITKSYLLGDITAITSGFGGASKVITNRCISQKQIPVLRGRNIQRYHTSGCYYFDFTKDNITGRTTDKEKLGSKEKVLIRKTGIPLYATYDDTGRYPEQSLYFIYKSTKYPLKFILAILNSQVFNWFYKTFLVTNRDSTPQVKLVDIKRFPIPECTNIELIKRICLFVDLLLKEEDVKKRQIIDNNLSLLVYRLYGLSKEEIEIVERSTSE